MRAELGFAFAALFAVGMACEKPRSFECEPPARVQELSDIHYEGASCDAAIQSAESRLTTAYYRKACEQLAPDQGVPPNVSDAYVAACRPAEDGGAMLDIRICCP